MRTTTVPRGAQGIRGRQPRTAAVRSAATAGGGDDGGRSDRVGADGAEADGDGAGRGGADWGGAGGPLSGTALLERLRVTGRARPAADPEFSADLRSFVEDGVVDPSPSSSATGAGRLLVTRDRLTTALACPGHRSAARSADGWPGGPVDSQHAFTTSLACGALVGALFRQIVAVGGFDDPMVDGLQALSLDSHQAPLVDWIGGLSSAERSGLGAEVDRQARGLLERWPALDASWLPRTQEMLRAPLVGGAVELCVRVDLAVGRPMGHEASVALVDVVSGARRPEHGDDRRFAALVAALRGPVPPFAVATYYSRTGELDVDPVDQEYLVTGAHRCLTAIRVLVGADQSPSDGATCAACRLLLRRPPFVVSVDGAERPEGSAPGATAGPVARADRGRPIDPVVAFPQEVAA